ncbi:hypothetical protein M406DRAFT_333859 [Cryphonectria parasitica EP155]|uniref:DUF8213 domain-containing protein n=1 Tax=Cryphonectria parasitica (strain ATCC 38755 / EP155) TaxID=660469 RepID=A0A9P4XV14_CRYP1|nr:uncharacterized protein M406DRAFT_333859 [Cryphonectria parasitica EP155]KAF3761812.1 hypothetical protein M406DRAFT_333859 [Cryphonectria parasitica EP155]
MFSTYLISLLTLGSIAHAMPNSPVSPLSRRSVTCLTVGATATATWTNAEGQTCTFKGVVGSNYGENASGGDYACNGRCGSACDGTAIGNVYTQDCFTHDICSYFELSTDGASDPNCGAAYVAAEDDLLLGYVDGCSQTNPDNAVAPPTTSPVCS